MEELDEILAEIEQVRPELPDLARVSVAVALAMNRWMEKKGYSSYAVKSNILGMAIDYLGWRRGRASVEEEYEAFGEPLSKWLEKEIGDLGKLEG